MILLVIRCGNTYLRLRDNENGKPFFEFLPLYKASVFPLSRLDELREYSEELASLGKSPELRQLTILEEPFTNEK